MQESFDVQAAICDTYPLDFVKYRPQADKYCLNAVFTTAAQVRAWLLGGIRSRIITDTRT